MTLFRRTALALCTTLMLLVPAATITAPAAHAATQVQVHAGPSAQSPMLGYLWVDCWSIGHSPRQGNWWQVAMNGGTGWVYNNPAAPFCI